MVLKGESNIINTKSVLIFIVSVIATLFLTKGNKKVKRKKSRVKTFSILHSIFSSLISLITVKKIKKEVVINESNNNNIKIEEAILFDIIQ